MAYSESRQAVSTARSAEARNRLYKADHPRAIDRYIDFFGEGVLLSAADADCCGDLLLELLA
jgi:hypothetical protein